MRNGPLLTSRLLQGVRDPWVTLAAVLGGGVAWALGVGLLEAAAVGGLMLAGAAGVSAARDRPTNTDDALPRLAPGTPQARLVATLDGYLGDLRQLRASNLPSEVKTSAIEALVAAGGARDTAHRVALAVDGLDGAIVRAQDVAAQSGTGSTSIRDSYGRMMQRRAGLLAKLGGAVNEVAEVYTKLLELSVTIDTLGVGGADLGEVETVNASVDALRGAFAELQLTRPTDDDTDDW